MSKQLLLWIGLLNLLYNAQATPCTKGKGECRGTLFVKSSCVNDKCKCRKGYAPAIEGCKKDVVPTLTIEAHYSGEAVTGSTNPIAFICSPADLGDGNYRWYSNDKLIDNAENGKYLKDVTAVAAEEFITCKIFADEYESEISNKLPVVTIAANGVIKKQPVVYGMPSASLPSKIELFCGNIPKTQYLVKFQWFEGKTEINGQTDQKYSLSFTDPKRGQNFKCRISPDTKDTYTIENPESASVKAPEKIASKVPGVKLVPKGPIIILENGDLHMNCEIKAKNFNNEGVTYLFFLNGKPYRNTKGNSTTTLNTVSNSSNGIWECQAKGNGETVKSQKLMVHFHDTNKRPGVTIYAPVVKPVENSCFHLRCVVDYFDSEVFNYRWTYDGKPLVNQHDHTIQYCTPKKGKFTCQVYTEAFTSQESTVTEIFSPVPITQLKPVLTSDKPKSENYGLGNTYTFHCNLTAFWAPGMTLVWSVDGKDMKKPEEYLKVKATNKSQTISCSAKYLEKSSQLAVAKIASNKVKALISVTVELNQLGNSGITGPSKIFTIQKENITLQCVVKTAADSKGELTYSWKVGRNVTPDATQKTFLVTSGLTAITVRCRATLGVETLESQIFTVKGSTSRSYGNPELTLTTAEANVTELRKGHTYSFLCLSDTMSDLYQVSWILDGRNIKGKNIYLMKKFKKKTADQMLTCLAQQGNFKANATLALSVGDDGVICAKSKECEDLGSKFSGICDAKTKRCPCRKGYRKQGEKCVKSGSANQMSSFLVITQTIFLLSQIL